MYGEIDPEIVRCFWHTQLENDDVMKQILLPPSVAPQKSACLMQEKVAADERNKKHKSKVKKFRGPNASVEVPKHKKAPRKLKQFEPRGQIVAQYVGDVSESKKKRTRAEGGRKRRKQKKH